jgi:paraquat-inducible protein B
VLQVGRQKLQDLEMDKINASSLEFLASLNRAVADANIQQLSRQMRSVLISIDQKLAALNMVRINDDIEQLLASLNQTVMDANLPAVSQEAQSLISEVRMTNKHLRGLLAPPEGMADQPNVPEVVARLSQTISQLNRVLATERPEIQTILSELRETMDSLSELISDLRERPSELLFSSPPRKSEVLR